MIYILHIPNSTSSFMHTTVAEQFFTAPNGTELKLSTCKESVSKDTEGVLLTDFNHLKNADHAELLLTICNYIAQVTNFQLCVFLSIRSKMLGNSISL